MSSQQAEARAKGALEDILKQQDYNPDYENLSEWLTIIKNFVKKVPLCLECGNIMVERGFVDSWDAKQKPCDVNRDFYCPNCGLRWSQTLPPHEFLKEAEPSG